MKLYSVNVSPAVDICNGQQSAAVVGQDGKEVRLIIAHAEVSTGMVGSENGSGVAEEVDRRNYFTGPGHYSAYTYSNALL